MSNRDTSKRPSIARRSGWYSLPYIASALIGTPALADVLVNNPLTDTTAQQTQSEAALLVFGSTVIAAFNDSGSFVGGANKFTGYARSTNGGLSFTDMGTLPTNQVGDVGDPRLARDNATGTIYLTTLGFSGGLQVFRSNDNGLTFGAPVNIAASLPANNALDRHGLAVDNFAGAGQGTVYIAVRDFGPGNGIYLVRSTDGGLTFGPAILIASGAAGNVQGPNVVVAPDHSVTVSYFRTSGATNSLVERRSTDLGFTFGAPVSIGNLGSPATVNGDLGLTGVRAGTVSPAAFRTDSFPQVVVNPVTGTYYLVYNDNPAGSDKADVFLRISNDNAATWSAPIRINDDFTTTDQWQPTLAVTPDGLHLGIFWYDRRLDPANDNLINYFGDICNVVGFSVICGANFRVSDVSFLPEFGRDPVVNTVYMGDYDIAQADNNFFYAAWGDNRDPSLVNPDINQPNVYFDRIPIEAAAVPLPGTVALMFAGMLAWAGSRRRRCC